MDMQTVDEQAERSVKEHTAVTVSLSEKQLSDTLSSLGIERRLDCQLHIILQTTRAMYYIHFLSTLVLMNSSDCNNFIAKHSGSKLLLNDIVINIFCCVKVLTQLKTFQHVK